MSQLGAEAQAHAQTDAYAQTEPPRGFDAVAERYDDDERRSPTLAHMRGRAALALDAAFGPLDGRPRLLELGSGTGTEAARLAAAGARIALTDLSPRLLARAQAKLRTASAARGGGAGTAAAAAAAAADIDAGSNGGDSLLGAHVLPAGRVGELEGVYGRGAFDGAYSSFGPLNCEPALEPVARGLAALVRPGGCVVLSIMNRWCATETAWFALHADLRQARRRWGGAGRPIQAAAYADGPKDVTTTYYARADVERAFGPAFRTEHVEALPLLWPPTYLDALVTRHAGLFALLEPLERRLARWPVLRELGDHVLLRLRRRG